MDDLVLGDDGHLRCGWGASTPDYATYHDTEWGRPVLDPTRLFEKLCLEGFQSGLSWLTILRKRENFRQAFAGFDPPTVADFGDDDVERLLGDAGIVRHRQKILAAIDNARAVVAMQEAGDRLDDLVWGFRPAERHHPRTFADVPASTSESAGLAKELRRRGFRFIGPTTAYAAMQSLGVVNDHLSGCWCRDDCESEQLAVGRTSRAGIPK